MIIIIMMMMMLIIIIILAAHQVVLAEPLDAEATNYYNISCVVNDGYLDSVGEYIELRVLNVNEPPQFNERTYYCSLYESKVTVIKNTFSFTIIIIFKLFNVAFNTFIFSVICGYSRNQGLKLNKLIF